MRAHEVKTALGAGERYFKDWKLTEPVEVLDWGKTWVRYKTPSMKWFISTNMRTFAIGLDGVYKHSVQQQGPEATETDRITQPPGGGRSPINSSLKEES